MQQLIDQIIHPWCHHLLSGFRFELSDFPRLVSAPPSMPEQSPFVCIFGDPTAKDLNPARMLLKCEPGPHQSLSMETVAHFLRHSGQFDEAQQLYQNALRATGHTAIDAILACTKLQNKVALMTPVPDLKAITPESRRHVAHCFAGLALCVLFRDREPLHFCSLAAAALSWDCPRELELAGMLRALLLLFAVFLRETDAAMVPAYQALNALNTKIILPMVLKTGDPALMDGEKALSGGKWRDALAFARTINQRAELRTQGAIPNPRGSITHTHIVDGQIVERRCVCGIWEATTNRKFMRCGACKAVYYCSKECQTADWQMHKKACKGV